MAQTVGYIVAATGPVVVGVLRETSGGWTAPLVFLLAMLAPLLAAGLGAARRRQVG
jgi:MFS transporter, CP family, cyanate transporter